VNGRVWGTVLAVGALSAAGIAPSEARTGADGAHQPAHPMTQCTAPDLTTGTRTCTYTFVHNETVETFVVPPTAAGPVKVTAVGAPGFGEDASRSRGARVTGEINALRGTPLFVVVGGDGYYDGYNGGVDGGGGASDVRMGMADLQHRILVAGGGGGAGEALVFDAKEGIWRFVVVKGGDAGQPGLAEGGGRPGSDSAGGEGGGNEPTKGWPGRLGWGGEGSDRGGGGGGGGFYGGGGGGGCSGGDGTDGHLCTESRPGSGGGGSSLVPPGGTSGLSDVLDPTVTITVTEYI
jgi:Glycine rich protein